MSIAFKIVKQKQGLQINLIDRFTRQDKTVISIENIEAGDNDYRNRLQALEEGIKNINIDMIKDYKFFKDPEQELKDLDKLKNIVENFIKMSETCYH